ncbi:ankyrin repeat domain-containing protein 26-like [Ictidomys tridecemlineatus]
MDLIDFVSLSKIEDAVISSQRTMEHRKCHCSQCSLFIEKVSKMETKVDELKIKLSDAKKVNAMLEHEKAEWKQELSNLRCELQEEKKKRKNADHLLKEIKHQLREKEEDYNKEMEIKRQLEMALKTRDMELNTERNKLKQVSTSNKMGKDLLDKYLRIKDINARKIIEIDTIIHEDQEKEKKYLEDFEILKGKYDDLQKTIKLKEETTGVNPFQDNEQFNKMKDEITTLKFQLEYEKENRERLETEFKSYRATLAAAPSHQYEGHTSYQEFAFQSAREEYFCSQAKMKFVISCLKAHSEFVSEKLVKNEERFCILKNKVHQTIHTVKEMNLNLETLQKNLRQCQIKKVKYTYHNEQTKVNKYDGKQDSMKERSRLQTENTLLQQQLHKPHNESVNKDTVISNQPQCHDIVDKLRAETKNHNLLLENIINKFINKCDHIEERRNQYENEKTERTVSIKHKNI